MACTIARAGQMASSLQGAHRSGQKPGHASSQVMKLSDGKGNGGFSTLVLPTVYNLEGILHGDWDGDGHVDLFILAPADKRTNMRSE